MSNVDSETQIEQLEAEYADLAGGEEGAEVGSGGVDIDRVLRAKNPAVESPETEGATPGTQPEGLDAFGMDISELQRQARGGRKEFFQEPSAQVEVSVEQEQDVEEPVSLSEDDEVETSAPETSGPSEEELEAQRAQANEALAEAARQQAAADRASNAQSTPEQIQARHEELLRQMEESGDYDQSVIDALREQGPAELQAAYTAEQTRLNQQHAAAQQALNGTATSQAQADLAAGTTPPTAQQLQQRHEAALNAMAQQRDQHGNLVYDASVIEALRLGGPGGFQQSYATEQGRLNTQLQQAQASIQTNAQAQATADFANNSTPNATTLQQRQQAGLTALQNSGQYDPAVLAALQRNMSSTYQTAYDGRRNELNTERTQFNTAMAELARQHALQDATLTAPRSAAEQQRVNEEREAQRAALRVGRSQAVLQSTNGGMTPYQAAYQSNFDTEFNRLQASREAARVEQVRQFEQSCINATDRHTTGATCQQWIIDYARNNPGVLTAADIERISGNVRNTSINDYNNWYNNLWPWEKAAHNIGNFISDCWNSAVGFVRDCVNAVVGALHAIGRSLTTAVQLIGHAATAIRQAGSAVVEWVGERVSEARDWVVENVVQPVVRFCTDPDYRREVWNNACNAVSEFVQDRWNQIRTGVSTAWNACVDGFNAARDFLTDPNTWRAIGNGIQAGWSGFCSACQAGWSGVCAAAAWASNPAQALRDIVDVCGQGLELIGQGLEAAWDGVCAAADFLTDPATWEAAWNGICTGAQAAWGGICTAAAFVTDPNTYVQAWNGICAAAEDFYHNSGLSDMVDGLCEIGMGVLTGDLDRALNGANQLGRGLQRYGENLLEGARMIGHGLAAAGHFLYDMGEQLGINNIVRGAANLAVGIATLDFNRIGTGIGQLARGAFTLVVEATGVADICRGCAALGKYLYNGLTGKGWDHSLLLEAALGIGMGALSIGMLIFTGGTGNAAVAAARTAGSSALRTTCQRVCNTVARMCYQAVKETVMAPIQMITAIPQMCRNLCRTCTGINRSVAMGGQHIADAVSHAVAPHVRAHAPAMTVRIATENAQAAVTTLAHEGRGAINAARVEARVGAQCERNGRRAFNELMETAVHTPAGPRTITQVADDAMDQTFNALRNCRSMDDYTRMASQMPHLQGATAREIEQAARHLRDYNNAIRSTSNGYDVARQATITRLQENMTTLVARENEALFRQTFNQQLDLDLARRSNLPHGHPDHIPAGTRSNIDDYLNGTHGNPPRSGRQRLNDAAYEGHHRGVHAAAGDWATARVDRQLPERTRYRGLGGDMEEELAETASYRGVVVEVNLAKGSIVERTIDKDIDHDEKRRVKEDEDKERESEPALVAVEREEQRNEDDRGAGGFGTGSKKVA